MKTRLLTASMFGILSLAGFAGPAWADGEEAAASPWSATLALTSDYRFRGISQTDRGVAVQGSIDFKSETGFFAGAWASNIDFNDDATYDSSVELDLYAGYTHAFSDTTEGTLKFVYYAYPDADTPTGFADYDYWEIIASLSHDFGPAAVSAEVGYSDDFFAGTGQAIEVSGGLSVPLCDKLWFFDGGLSASAHAGYQWYDDAAFNDYAFYDAGLSASVGMFTLDVRWVDSDIGTPSCGGTDWCEGGVVVTGSVAFGG